MKRLTLLVLWLYPHAWRRRYRAELEALIEDSGSGWRVIADLLKESLKMQLTTWSFGKLATVLGLAGFVAAGVTSALIPPTYVSQAELEITPAAGRGNNLDAAQYLLRIRTEILSRTSLYTLIQDPRLDLYPSERESTPLEDVIEKMRTQDIRIRLDSPSTFSISFRYPDKVKAQKTVQAMMMRFMDRNRAEARLGVYAGEPLLEVLEPPFSQGTRIPLLPLDWEDVAPAWLRPDFVSQAVLEFVDSVPVENSQQLTERITRMQKEVLSRTSLSMIIQDPRLDLYKDERKLTPLEDVIEKMRRDVRIRIDSTSNPRFFTLSFRYPNREKARQTVQTLITKFQDANPANRRFHEGLVQMIHTDGLNLGVLDPPSLPSLPAKPNRYFITSIGLVAGILFAAAVKLLLKRRTVMAT
jgi:hypothetical protein